MASLGDVSRFLRQRRAVGKPITAEDRRAAWNAYYDTQAVKSLERSRIANQRDQFNQQMAFNKKQSEDAAKANSIRGIIDLGTLGYKAYNSDLGKTALYKAKTLMGMDATGLPELAGGSSPIGGALTDSPTSINLLGTSSTGAQGLSTQAVTNLAPAATEGVSGTGLSALAEGSSPISAAPVNSGVSSVGATALSYAGPAMAGYTAGEWGQDLAMRSETVQNIAEKATFGLLHAKKDVARVTGAGTGAAAGALLGGPVGAIIGGIMGAIGVDTWLCTETKKKAGFTDVEWAEIGTFRKYAEEYHPDWLSWYVSIGTELVQAIDGDEDFYKNLKETFLLPMIALSKGGFHEAVCVSYIEVVKKLVLEYKPELMEGI